MKTRNTEVAPSKHQQSGVLVHCERRANKVCTKSTTEHTHMGKDHLLTRAISHYRISLENLKFSSPVRHSALPQTTDPGHLLESLFDVTVMKLPKSTGVDNCLWYCNDSHLYRGHDSIDEMCSFSAPYSHLKESFPL
ncbi:hypothetical protein TNCV_414401 [Trichonephila clavipes]|nr:hypothetical protein TNCV_414401 [Trichonephila clavipes]